MSTLTSQELQQQYIAYFGRPGDPTGIEYWLNKSDVKTAKEFALKISAQDEYANGIGSQPVADQVNALYVNLFGRNADAEGLIYWTNQVKDGVLSLGNLAYDLIVAAGNPVAGNEGQAALDAQALAKKTAAAELFTENVKLGGFILSYDNEDAFAVARSFVETVKADSQFTTEQLTTFTQSQVLAMSTAEATAQVAEAATANQLTPLEQAQLLAAQAQTAAAQAELNAANQAAVDAVAAKAEAAAAKEAADAAAELAANADASYKFTKTTDNLVGAGGADTFSGVVQAGTGDGTTIFPGDFVDGGEGIDTIAVSVAGINPDAGQTYVLSAITSENVEKYLVSNFEATAANSLNTFETGLMTGLTTVGLTASSVNGDTAFSWMKNFVDAEMRNGAANLTLDYSGQQVITGESDSQNLTVSAVTAGTFTANGIETINVTTEVNKSTLADIDSDKLKTLNISGDQNLTVTGPIGFPNNVTNSTEIDATVDASNATGNVTLNVGGSNSTLSVTGGTGDDTINFEGKLTKDDVVDGGDGTDTISMDPAALDKQLDQVSNFETFAFNASVSADTIDASKLPASIKTIQIDSSDSTATGTSPTIQTINKIAEGSSVVIKKTVKDKNGGNATDAIATGDGVNVTLNEADDTTTNAIDITLDAVDVYTSADVAGGGLRDVSAANYETITLQSNKNKAGTITANEVERLVAGEAETITVTGNADLTINDLTGNSLTDFDASGLSGKLVLSVSGTNASKKATYTAPSSQTTFDFASGKLNYLDTVKGGSSSKDELTAELAGLTATTGDLNISGIETLTFNTSNDNIIDLTNITGASTLEVSANVQTITGLDLTSGLTIRADDITGGAKGDATLKVTATDSTGDADVLKVARRLSTAGDGTTTVETSGIETLNIVVEDTIGGANTATWALSKFDGTSIVASEGSKDTADVAIDLGTLKSTVNSIDTSGVKGAQTAVASAATSSVTFNGNGKAVNTFTGGERDDTFTISETGAVTHSLSGGDGSDTATVGINEDFVNPSGLDVETVTLSQKAGDDVTLGANFNGNTTKISLTGGNSLSTFTQGSTEAIVDAVTNYDASGFEGNVVLNVAADKLDSTLTVTGTGSTTDSITGSISGAGTDTPKIKDIYTVNLSTTAFGGTATVDFSDSSGFKKISSTIGTNDTLVLDKLDSGASLKVVGAASGAVLNPKLSDDAGSDDKLTIELKASTNPATPINNNFSINVSDVETITLKSSTTGGETLSLANVSMDAASATTALKITGSKALTVTATHEDIASVDASGMSAGGSYTENAVAGGRANLTATTRTGSDGADTFIMSHKDDTIDGGANPDPTANEKGDTLDMQGAELVIGGVEVDLSNADDNVISFNGFASTGIQKNFESVDLSSVTNIAAYGSIVTAHKGGSIISGLNGGRDVVFGGAGADQISGNDGDDNIRGAGGNDVLNGDGGHDTILGGDGDDTMSGGAGNDSVSGGLGTNVYVFDTDDTTTTDILPDLSSSATAGAINQFYVQSSEDFIGNIKPNVANAGTILTGLSGIGIKENQDATFSGAQLTTLTVGVIGEAGGNKEDLIVTATASGTTDLSKFEASADVAVALNGGDNTNETLKGTKGPGTDTISPGTGTDLMTGGTGGTNIYVWTAGDASAGDTITDLDDAASTTVNQFNITVTDTFASTIDPNAAGNGAVLTGLDSIVITEDKTATFAGVQLDGLTLSVTESSGSGAATLIVTPTAGGAETDLSSVTAGTGVTTVLTGGGDIETIKGTTGVDHITGAALIDVLTGGAGADKFLFTSGLTLGTDADVIKDGSAEDIYAIHTHTGTNLHGNTGTGLATGDGTPLDAIADGAKADASLATAINVATAGAVTVSANANVLEFVSDGNGAGFAGGFAGLVAAQDGLFDLNEFGGTNFTTEKMIAVVEDSTNNQIEIGQVTFATANGVTDIASAALIYSIDITGGLTRNQVALAIDLVGIA